jgi:bla regulator protein blaR1
MIPELTNHLWQSTLFALAAALLGLAFRKNRARVRYGLWLAASIKFLLPFALLMGLGNSVWSSLAARKIALAVVAPPVVSVAIEKVSEPFSSSVISAPAASHAANWLPLALFAIWACGFCSVAFMRFRGWLRIRSAVRASEPIDIAVPVALRASSELLEPGVVGFFRPTLLLPDGILENLSPPQLGAVIAHELAHIRRRDNLTAAIQMLVEALFWFYPVVWWIGARLVEERERACDESVLNLGNESQDYAEAILNVCKLYVESPLVCVSGVTGASLKKRIHRILADTVGRDLTVGKKIALAAAAAFALTLPVAVGILDAPQARAQSADTTAAAFEVASVKPDENAAHYRGENIDIDEDNDFYTGTGLTPRYLIEYAYGLTSNDQLSGGPSWVNSDKFVINAKSDDTLVAKWKGNRKLKEANLRAEMRSLLEERFQLKVSHQTKELPVFELVVAKGGPKFAASPDTNDNHHNDGHNQGDVEILDIKNEPISDFVQELSRQPELAGHLVIDKTGLTDSYSFAWKWTRQRNSAQAVADGDSTSAPPSIWTALQEQLGLKLESAKAPVDCIVIDQIEHPTPN